jgi:hypothetical protein
MVLASVSRQNVIWFTHNCEGGERGGAVVEALRYTPEGRGIDSRWCQNFSLTYPSGRTMALGST